MWRRTAARTARTGSSATSFHNWHRACAASTCVGSKLSRRLHATSARFSRWGRDVDFVKNCTRRAGRFPHRRLPRRLRQHDAIRDARAGPRARLRRGCVARGPARRRGRRGARVRARLHHAARHGAHASDCVEIKILRRIPAESSRRPPRHRRDACSMAWRCRFLAARPSQDGRVIAEK